MHYADQIVKCWLNNLWWQIKYNITWGPIRKYLYDPKILWQKWKMQLDVGNEPTLSEQQYLVLRLNITCSGLSLPFCIGILWPGFMMLHTIFTEIWIAIQSEFWSSRTIGPLTFLIQEMECSHLAYKLSKKCSILWPGFIMLATIFTDIWIIIQSEFCDRRTDGRTDRKRCIRAHRAIYTSPPCRLHRWAQKRAKCGIDVSKSASVIEFN